MLNQVCIVGVVKRVERSIDGLYYLWLEVERNFKEFDGTFKKDVVKCRIWKAVIDEIEEFYQVDQRLSVSGRIESEDGNNVIIVCYDVEYLGVSKKVEVYK